MKNAQPIRTLQRGTGLCLWLLLISWALNSCSSSVRSPSSYPLWGELQPGPYRVGFATEVLSDPLRSSGREPGRPRSLRFSLWYPARASSDHSTLPFSTYVELLFSDDRSRLRARENQELLISSLAARINPVDGHRIDRESLRRLLETSSAAQPDAAAAAGRFPTLLWGMRHSTILNQSVLSEFLASHGWVVACVQPLELRPPYPYLELPPQEMVATVGDWTRDLEVAGLRLDSFPFVDTERGGVISWSYGGISAVLAALRNPTVDFMISLDSTEFWTSESLALFNRWQVHSLDIPLLEIRIQRERGPSLSEIARSAPRWRLVLPLIGHGNFNAAEGYIPELFGLSPPPPWSQTGAVALSGYRFLAETVLDFLTRAASSGDLESWEPPRQILAGEPVSWTFSPGQDAEPGEWQQVQQVLDGQLLYSDLEPGWVDDVTYRLLEDGFLEEARALADFQLAAQPDSADALVLLAEVLMGVAEFEEASQHLVRALEIDSEHPVAGRLMQAPSLQH